MPDSSSIYDCIIIGGGPAGLTCAIFLGRYTPEAIGDYIAGPNHVLPTARSARFASGLGVLDFLKRSSLVRCDAASLAVLGPPSIRLAEAEGLDAHALSLSLRLDRPGGK